MKPLTDRQHMLLDAIITYLRAHDSYPTIRELGAAMEINSTNGVSDHLKALAKKGYIERGADQARAIRVLRDTSGRPFLSRAELEAEVERLRALAGVGA